MIIARGIGRYHGFETTAAYRDAFAKLERPFAGQAPSPGNTHSVVGPHGLFSIHNIGLFTAAALISLNRQGRKELLF